MPELDPASLDLPTLASLAGGAANEYLLGQLRAAGYDGIRTSHGYVIQLVIDREPTVGEVAAQLGVTQQAASKTVADLEGLGILVRHTGTDGRVRTVALTTRGRALVQASRRERRALERRVRTVVGEEDVAAAQRALAALLAVTGQSRAVAGRRARAPSA